MQTAEGLPDDVALELESLAREEAWFMGYAERVMAAAAQKLAACVAPWARPVETAPSGAASPGAEDAVVVAVAPSKAVSMSVDDILAQARAPKNASGTPQRAAKKEKEKQASAQTEEDRMVSFRSPDQTFSGFVVIQGYNCVDAELKILFASNHRGTSGSAELEIRGSRPWRLVQLQNAALFVACACQCLEEKKLGDALQQLRAARAELVRPNSRIFPPDPRVFHPRLPGELFVEFLIVDRKLQANAVLVRPATGLKYLPPMPLCLAEVKPGDIIGCGVGKAVEVLEVTRVTSAMPAVAAVAETIEAVASELTDLANKMQVFAQ